MFVSVRESHRPRNAVATRQAILDVAKERFIAHSYDDVGIRDIAREVGVDAALVSRYFGSKEDLFNEALDSCKGGPELWEGDRSTFGLRIAREIVNGEFDCPRHSTSTNRLAGLLMLLRSIGSAKAMEMVQRNSNERFFGPLTEWIGGSNAHIRARLVAGLIMGMAVSRELADGFSSLGTEDLEELAQSMGKTLQSLVDGH
ncbi:MULTISPECIES: TetR/AcrR family transcriptional regulator [unclassified Brevundimonas]|uniref:TetR/AcrR family transcriptional regulator n=1 Tax=unclassified Brevundimonas TaxID=2622653 RepID=UPI0025B8B105|nr:MULTISPECIES: TetR/AcrR family transcriptional regulator [unclassified Brevundimonas]